MLNFNRKTQINPKISKYIKEQRSDNFISTWVLQSALQESEWWYVYYELARQTYSSVFNPTNREWEGKLTIRGMKHYIYNELKKRSSYVLVEVQPATSV